MHTLQYSKKDDKYEKKDDYSKKDEKYDDKVGALISPLTRAGCSRLFLHCHIGHICCKCGGCSFFQANTDQVGMIKWVMDPAIEWGKGKELLDVLLSADYLSKR